MKGLNTLIRLQKQKVDEIRRKLGALENQHAQLQKRSEELAKELKNELAQASQSPEFGGFFGDFAERIKKRRADLSLEMHKLERQMQELNDQVRIAFGELKKFEIARDNRIAEKKAKDAKREADQLDEIATLSYVRNKPKES